MHQYRLILIAALCLIQFTALLSSNSKNNSEILYLSPVPDSKYVTKETNIIIRYKSDLNFNTVSEKNFKITGSKSGEHKFQILQTDEKNTMILKPEVSFAPGEEVNVEILGNFNTVNSRIVSPYKLRFSISASGTKHAKSNSLLYEEILGDIRPANSYNVSNASPVLQTDLLPSDFPSVSVLFKDHPDPGYLFLANLAFGPTASPYLMVLDNSGYPILYKKMNSPCTDFKALNNNTFAYFDMMRGRYYATNTSLTVVDSFYCGNGYSTDLHELLLLPDNHAYLMSYDSQHVDMSNIVPGGDTNAIVSGLIVQEIDENKNVIFQWRSWDHFQITDTYVDLKAHSIDYVHGNAIDLDNDGNILISSRHMSEITKINRQNGNIMWRFGGKNNQFTISNDSIFFSFQHAIRHLSNGNYILYDNGNFHNPKFSRAVEYSLDTSNRTARLVWQYRNNPDIFGGAMGNAQRLTNGNTVIGWGSTNPSAIEVKPDGSKALIITLENGLFSYRAFKFMWDGAPLQIPSSLTLQQNFPNPFNPNTTIKFGISEDSYVSLKIYDILGREVKILVQENLEAGRYTVDFNSQGLSSGIYFYKLVANGSTDSKKMILVK